MGRPKERERERERENIRKHGRGGSWARPGDSQEEVGGGGGSLITTLPALAQGPPSLLSERWPVSLRAKMVGESRNAAGPAGLVVDCMDGSSRLVCCCVAPRAPAP